MDEDRGVWRVVWPRAGGGDWIEHPQDVGIERSGREWFAVGHPESWLWLDIGSFDRLCGAAGGRAGRHIGGLLAERAIIAVGQTLHV